MSSSSSSSSREGQEALRQPGQVENWDDFGTASGGEVHSPLPSFIVVVDVESVKWESIGEGIPSDGDDKEEEEGQAPSETGPQEEQLVVIRPRRSQRLRRAVRRYGFEENDVDVAPSGGGNKETVEEEKPCDDGLLEKMSVLSAQTSGGDGIVDNFSLAPTSSSSQEEGIGEDHDVIKVLSRFTNGQLSQIRHELLTTLKNKRKRGEEDDGTRRKTRRDPWLKWFFSCPSTVTLLTNLLCD